MKTTMKNKTFSMSSKGFANPWYILGALLLFFVVISTATGLLGLGTPRGESSYTGYVVDVEHNKGFIFRTSQVLVKTNPESSVAEEFCLDDPLDVQRAKKFQSNGKKVEIQYSRPIYVNPFVCDSSLSLVRSINATGGG